jgi:Kef-type K+ transport system membrane component KefB
MTRLTPHQVMIMFLALGTLLALARALGEVCKRLSQPAVVGEIIAGILLGPTVLGALAPQVNALLFPRTGEGALVMDGLATLAIVLYLLVAGIEVNLSVIWRQGRSAFMVSTSGIVVPFLLGFSAAWFTPGLLGREANDTSLVFALFFATALSISALPVIVKTLRDLALYRSDMGMIVVASAVFDDLIGWILFAVILSTMDGSSSHGHSVMETIGLTLAFAAGMLTVGRWLIHRILPWVQAHSSWPGGVLGFALCLALFGAATTEWIGIHAIFGSFFVGVAIGDSSHFREDTRNTIDQFVSYIFAPLFFASIGLRLNFATHFDWSLSLVVIIIACLGKVLGCGLAARWSGMEQREAWATAFGLNARGAMEIILGVLALEHGLIDERMFVALVALALVTSLMSGPAMWHLLGLTAPRRFIDHLNPGTFLNRLHARTSTAAIEEMAQALSPAAGLSAAHIATAVLNREHIMPTGIGNGVAIPRARLEELRLPLVGVGLTEAGIDFDAPDGQLAHVIFVILTPLQDHGAQIDILADIARTFEDEALHEAAHQVRSYTELLALLRTVGTTQHPPRPWPRPHRRERR